MGQALFDDATAQERIGVGRDGAWARGMHNAFEVVNVTRIENGPLWSTYGRLLSSIHSLSEVQAELPEEGKLDFEKAIQAIRGDGPRSEKWRCNPSKLTSTFVKSL